ncbi:DNA photolyase family protein [Crocinitomicaceae bacterium]|nr:DNA photolyase family protein [Crocinitomicaceae bacterium]
MKISVFWFRRDLRLNDNTGLSEALKGQNPVLPIFIFDDQILDELPEDDARVQFIHDQLSKINSALKKKGSSLKILKGNPEEVWKSLFEEFKIEAVFTNRDYEPYASLRDQQVEEICKSYNAEFHTFKDQVVFEKSEVVKDDGDPYVVYTPYKNKWLERLKEIGIPEETENHFENLLQKSFDFPSLSDIGFKKSSVSVPDYSLEGLENYEYERDFPAKDSTSHLSVHLRFGTVSTREMVRKALKINATFLSELIWREFFMQILSHYPKVVDNNFRSKYDGINWRNNEEEFERWCEGNTGYPLVDAGMRELNATGIMHNRVRMVTASFLCKHLLIDWKWGEAYFAQKLLDYDLSANNGNWQWAAGTGCDASPYFRVFNPSSQLTKFDKNLEYVRKWVPEYEGFGYPEPMVDHKTARERALSEYKKGIEANQ